MKKIIISIIMILSINFLSVMNINLEASPANDNILSLAENSEYFRIDDLEDESDIIERERSYKANGGVVLSWINLDLDNLNASLPIEFLPIPEVMNLSGGGANLGFVEGSRIAIYGLSGSNTSISNQGYKSSLDINYSGLLYERCVFFDGDIDIAAGVLLGKGSASLDL
ncbi:MAG: hypothetical protein ACOCRO_06080, partial [Halanaerobiales bacterium]